MRIQRLLVPALAFLATALAACTSEEKKLCESGTCASRVVVAKSIGFVTEEAPGVSDGFNLDGAATTGSDSTGCSREDYVSPLGILGVDNQLARLWPSLVDATGDAIPGLLKGAIADGTLLLMVQLDGVDDPKNDACVDASIFVGAGKPDIGADGLITSGQTFDVLESSPLSIGKCGSIANGELNIGPFEADVPVRILDVNVTLRLHGARLRATLADDGGMRVVVGGGVEIEQLKTIAPGEERVSGLVDTVARRMADLGQDETGVCQHLSVTLRLDAVSAFVFDKSAPPAPPGSPASR